MVFTNQSTPCCIP